MMSEELKEEKSEAEAEAEAETEAETEAKVEAEEEKNEEKTEDKAEKGSSNIKVALVNAITRHPRQIGLMAAGIIFLVILGAVFIRISSRAAYAAYSEEKEAVSGQAYDMFYGTIYDAAEASHHVSNEITISIGSLQEESKLEVLRVSDIVYEVTESGNPKTWTSIVLSSLMARIMDDSVQSWMKVPGNGVFTVDLESAEFIIDNDDKYVLVRMMRPELSEFTIDYANVEQIYFEDNALLHNPAKVGVDLAMEQLEDAQKELTDKINSSERFRDSACNAAVNIVTGFVKELNSDVPDLTVEIEFLN